MARDGGVSCLRMSSETMSVGIESAPLDLDEVHVLAVDDSLVDRIVIERLLRVTSCKGSSSRRKQKFRLHFFFFLAGKFLISPVVSFSVTAVDSGWRALEFLGLGNEKASAEFDVSHVI